MVDSRLLSAEADQRTPTKLLEDEKGRQQNAGGLGPHLASYFEKPSLNTFLTPVTNSGYFRPQSQPPPKYDDIEVTPQVPPSTEPSATTRLTQKVDPPDEVPSPGVRPDDIPAAATLELIPARIIQLRSRWIKPLGFILMAGLIYTVFRVYALGHTLCQTTRFGCQSELPLMAAKLTSNNSGKCHATGSNQGRCSGASIEGAVIMGGIQGLGGLTKVASATSDMELLALQLSDKTGFSFAPRLAQDLARMPASYERMYDEKDQAFSATLSLFRKLVDRHDNALNRLQLRESASSWYNRPSRRGHQKALSTEVTSMIRQFNNELVPARRSLRVTEREANSILGIITKTRAKSKYELEKLRQYHATHPVSDALCYYGMGDFELAGISCNAIERSEMITLLDTLVRMLDTWLSGADQLSNISKRLQGGLISFSGALNDTAGVLPDRKSIQLRGDESDLLLFGYGVAGLSTNLNKIDTSF